MKKIQILTIFTSVLLSSGLKTISMKQKNSNNNQNTDNNMFNAHILNAKEINEKLYFSHIKGEEIEGLDNKDGQELAKSMNKKGLYVNGQELFAESVQKDGKTIYVTAESEKSKLERLSYNFAENLLLLVYQIESDHPNSKDIIDNFVDYIGIGKCDQLYLQGHMQSMRNVVMNEFMKRMKNIHKHGNLIPQIIHFYMQSNKEQNKDDGLFEQRMIELSVLYRHVLYLDLYKYIFEMADNNGFNYENNTQMYKDMKQEQNPIQLLMKFPQFENMSHSLISDFLKRINIEERAVQNTDKELIIKIIDDCLYLSKFKINSIICEDLFLSDKTEGSTELEDCLHSLKKSIKDILDEAKGFIRNEKKKSKKIKQQMEDLTNLQKKIEIEEKRDKAIEDQEAKRLKAEKEKKKNAEKLDKKRRKEAETLETYSHLESLIDSAQEKLKNLNKTFQELKKEGKKPSEKQMQDMKKTKDHMKSYKKEKTTIEKDYPHLFQKQEEKVSSPQKNSSPLDKNLDQQINENDEKDTKNENIQTIEEERLVQIHPQNEMQPTKDIQKSTAIISSNENRINEINGSSYKIDCSINSDAPYTIKYDDSGVFVEANQNNSVEVLQVIQKALALHYNQSSYSIIGIKK